MDLASLGWSNSFKSIDTEVETLARITAVHRSHLRAITVSGEINIHHSSGQGQIPAIGDWVLTTPPFIDEQDQPAALVKELIPRKSKISRVSAGDLKEEQIMAANIDTVFVVTSINQDFNLNRLQRFLVLIKEGAARPVIILSKTDLEASHIQIIEELKNKLDKDILILSTSVVNKYGIDEVKSLMPKGSTSVFIGSSGVGKSSLVNALLGQDIQTVREIREDDGKGRHATTSRQMFFIPDGGMIIDTPGIRDVSVFGTEEKLSENFSDIEDLFTQCKYSDCKHSTEPGCAILKSIETQELDKKRWNNYNKLSKEIAFNNKKMSKEATSNSKKRWKKIQTDYKSRKKLENKN